MRYGDPLHKTNILTIYSDTIYEGKEIMSITPDENGNLSFDTYIKSSFYENNFARIKPFMMSYGRLKIANIILTNLDSVIRVHTDGIICTKPITNVKLGNDLGDLKYEGSANCNIINANTYYWEDDRIITLKQCLFDKCSYIETYNKLKNL